MTIYESSEKNVYNEIIIVISLFCDLCKDLIIDKLNHLVDKQPSNMRIQIIFGVFERKGTIQYNITSHFINTINLNKAIFFDIVKKWYSWEKNNRVSKFKHLFNIENNDIQCIRLDKQIEFCHYNNINQTPTLIHNGKIVNDIYDLSDLQYIIN